MLCASLMYRKPAPNNGNVCQSVHPCFKKVIRTSSLLRATAAPVPINLKTELRESAKTVESNTTPSANVINRLREMARRVVRLLGEHSSATTKQSGAIA